MLRLIISLVMACAVHAQEVIWVRNGETADAHFGQCIYPLGDQNEDGYADWMVSASGSSGSPLDDRVDLFPRRHPVRVPQNVDCPLLSFFVRVTSNASSE